jgi:hypothetical protein
MSEPNIVEGLQKLVAEPYYFWVNTAAGLIPFRWDEALQDFVEVTE